MTVKPFFVRAEWDEEASVWVATSDRCPRACDRRGSSIKSIAEDHRREPVVIY